MCNKWVDQSTPALTNEDWEHGSVYEPNLIYHGSKWKMWYVAGSARRIIVRVTLKARTVAAAGQASSLHRGRKSLRLLRHSIPEWLPGRVFARDARQTVTSGSGRIVVVRSQSAIKQIFRLEQACPDLERGRSRLAFRPMETLLAI